MTLLSLKKVFSNEKRTNTKVKEDIWLHSICDMCFAECPTIAHRVNGVVVKVEGDPHGPHGNGRLCAKGFAAPMSLYDPSRLTKPLIRTNPEKGMDIDPKWKEISWDEALDIVAAKLKKIRDDDPRKVQLSTSSVEEGGAEFAQGLWAPAFGTPNTTWYGYFCGNYLHSAMFLANGTFHSHYDIEHCKYLILQGNQSGFMGGLAANLMSQKMADARIRGMKVVAVDPILTNAAGKADEWVSIRPGTDGAWLLGLIHVLVNELEIYDAEFLKNKTNAPYLIGPDGHYLRKNGVPLVWDPDENTAKPFNDQINNCALEGSYSIDGITGKPAFQLLKDEVRNYTPEKVAEITTIPADTIRRIAKDFGEAASIGETVRIDGQDVPYRPVAVNIYRGAGAHNHGVFTALAVEVLNMLMGAFYSVGSHQGTNLTGPDGSWAPHPSSDGLIVPHSSQGHGADYYDFEVSAPDTTGVNGLLPISTNRSAMVQHTLEDPGKFNLPYKVEMLIMFRHNQLMTSANPERTAEAFKKVPFVLYFATHIDEQANFADLLLPEKHFMERLELFLNAGSTPINPATGYYYWSLRQPLVEPYGESRQFTEVLIELAHRAGFSEDLYRIINAHNLKEPFRLDVNKKYTWAEILDRQAKSKFGPDMGLDWFKKHGSYKVKRTVEEKYPAAFLDVRFPIYFENMLRAGEEVEEVSKELGIDWDSSDYKAILNWRACPAFSPNPREDFYAVNYRAPIHSGTHSAQNPWLNELAKQHPSTYKILMNTIPAMKKGIQDGDKIEVKSEAGSVIGTVKVTQGVHPEVIGIAGGFGALSKGRPIAKGMGVHFNTLLPIDNARTDPISGGLDSCVRVDVTRVAQ